MTTFAQSVSVTSKSNSQPNSQQRSSPHLAYRVLGALMRTVGSTSDSIALGLQRGFDSGEMMDRIYANMASGRLGIGGIIDRVYLSQIGCQGLRQRKTLLKTALREALFAATHGAPNTHHEDVFIVDIAAGPGTYLVELCAEALPMHLHALCRDLDPHGLERGRALAWQHGVSTIAFAQGDALDATSLSAIAPKPDIVVSSGFYELLNDDDVICQSMALVRSVLQPHCFVFTTQVGHPQLQLIANTLPNRHGELWVMRNRTLTQVEHWARSAGFGTVRSTLTPNGLYAVTRCTN